MPAAVFAFLLAAVGSFNPAISLFLKYALAEDVALQALGGSMLLGEAVVRVVADTDLLAKLADFHAAVLNQPGNLAPDLIRVLRDGHAFDIDLRRGRRLPLRHLMSTCAWFLVRCDAPWCFRWEGSAQNP